MLTRLPTNLWAPHGDKFQVKPMVSHKISRKKRTIESKIATLWLFDIAMGNDPFIEMVYLLNMVIFHGYVK